MYVIGISVIVLLFKYVVYLSICLVFVSGFQIQFYSFICVVYLMYIVYYFFFLFLFCWFDQVSFHSLPPLLVFFSCIFPVAFSVPAFIIIRHRFLSRYLTMRPIMKNCWQVMGLHEDLPLKHCENCVLLICLVKGTAPKKSRRPHKTRVDGCMYTWFPQSLLAHHQSSMSSTQ